MQVAAFVDDVQDGGLPEFPQLVEVPVVRFEAGGAKSNGLGGVENAFEAGAGLRSARGLADQGDGDILSIITRDRGDAGGSAVGDVVLSDGRFHRSVVLCF